MKERPSDRGSSKAFRTSMGKEEAREEQLLAPPPEYTEVEVDYSAAENEPLLKDSNTEQESRTGQAGPSHSAANSTPSQSQNLPLPLMQMPHLLQYSPQVQHLQYPPGVTVHFPTVPNTNSLADMRSVVTASTFQPVPVRVTNGFLYLTVVEPVVMFCPCCNARTTTVVETQATNCAWISAFACCLLVPSPLCCLPFCLSGPFREGVHVCSRDGTKLAAVASF